MITSCIPTTSQTNIIQRDERLNRDRNRYCIWSKKVFSVWAPKKAECEWVFAQGKLKREDSVKKKNWILTTLWHRRSRAKIHRRARSCSYDTPRGYRADTGRGRARKHRQAADIGHRFSDCTSRCHVWLLFSLLLGAPSLTSCLDRNMETYKFLIFYLIWVQASPQFY